MSDNEKLSSFLVRHATLRQLQVFESVARNLSFTKAANELYLSQPTVSVQVKNLSEAVDVALYEQVGRNIYLTEVGEQVAKTCREVMAHLSKLEIAIDDYKGLKRGRLRVAVVTTAKYFMPLALGEFCRSYPEIELELTINNRETILKRLEQNLDDLYVVGQAPLNDLDVDVHSFAANPLVIISHNEHPLVGKTISLKRLSQEPFIMRKPGSGIRSAVEKLFAQNDLSMNERLTMENNEAIKQCVIAGLGVSCVSRHALFHDFQNPHSKIVELDVEGFPIQKEWKIVYPANKELSLLTQSFLDFLKDYGNNLAQI